VDGLPEVLVVDPVHAGHEVGGKPTERAGCGVGACLLGVAGAGMRCDTA
jgi:hypothetical protein